MTRMHTEKTRITLMTAGTTMQNMYMHDQVSVIYKMFIEYNGYECSNDEIFPDSLSN